MPDPAPHFEQKTTQALEADIARLTAEVARLKTTPEHAAKNGHELVRQSLQALTPAQTAPIAPAPATPVNPSSPLPSYAQDIPAPMKLEVEQLIEKALTEGIEKASEEAAKTNPFLMDTFHDALTTRLYPELKKRGVLE